MTKTADLFARQRSYCGSGILADEQGIIYNPGTYGCEKDRPSVKSLTSAVASDTAAADTKGNPPETDKNGSITEFH